MAWEENIGTPMATKPATNRRTARADACQGGQFNAADVLPLVMDLYWEQDLEFRLTHVSGELPECGLHLQDSLKKTYWSLGIEASGDVDWTSYQALLSAGQPVMRMLVKRAISTEDGTYRYLLLAARPVTGADGAIVGYQGTLRDVTDRELFEEESSQFRAAIDASSDRIFLVDYDSLYFIYANDAARRAANNLTLEQFRGVKAHAVLNMSKQQVWEEYDKVIAAGDAGLTTESEIPDRHGVTQVVALHRRAVKINGSWVIVSLSHDITARKTAERRSERLGRMFAALSETNEAILYAESIEDLYQRVCDAAVEGGKFAITGALLPDPETGEVSIAASAGATEAQRRAARLSIDSSAETGKGIVARAYFGGRSCVSNNLYTDTKSGWYYAGQQESDVGLRSAAAIPLMRDDRAVGVLLFFSREFDAFDDEIVRLLERMAENVVFALRNFEHEEQRKRSEERVQYLATHDGLTGLPNRVMFNELLHIAVETARRYERQFAVMFIDLDRFKVINDTLGHEAGDILLKEMAVRLKGCLRSSDVIARLGGDEFVVMVQEVQTREQVASIARKIIAATLQPVTIFKQECRVTASIGIAFCPADGEDPQELMKNADMAMYLAKDQGKNNFQFYAEEIQTRGIERLMLETHLRRALELDELSLHYQAKLDLQTGTVSGAEALLRWNSAELGAVSPAQMIPVAEETGLIVPIGRWVLRTACAQNMAWQAAGLPPLTMAVNLSSRQFADPHLLQDIADILKETGMPPNLLELEITETMLMRDVDNAVQTLKAIKALGVRIAIDDFGTGYSSLAQLKTFPIDTLKVDRSFIRDLPLDADDRSMTEAIIAMGKNLSLTIIAEGVETIEQQTFLRDHACDEMQGFYFARPVDAEAFRTFMDQHLKGNGCQSS
jgi:diguanylate cyclase (GGDEF)-like protein/PAS domain S-box-containing protein